MDATSDGLTSAGGNDVLAEFALEGSSPTATSSPGTRSSSRASATGSTAACSRTPTTVLANSADQQDIVVQDGDNGPGPSRLFATTPLRNAAGGIWRVSTSPAPCRRPSTSSTATTSRTPSST